MATHNLLLPGCFILWCSWLHHWIALPKQPLLAKSGCIRYTPALHAACLQPARSCMQFTRASGRLVGWLSSLSRAELDLKRSIWPGLAILCFGTFLVVPSWGSELGSPAHLPLYPPPGLPALVHHLLDLALLCSSGVTSGYCCLVCCVWSCMWCAHPLCGRAWYRVYWI